MVLQQTVKEVMSSPVLTVTPETALKDAVSLLSDHHISGLPVVDQSGLLIGELTEQDLMVRESGVDAGPCDAFRQRDLSKKPTQLGQTGASSAGHHGGRSDGP